MSTTQGAVGFDADIRPLFRERDRDAMIRAGNFDLWSYADVHARASAILRVLEAGEMPCDGAWPSERVDTFRRWSESGMNP